MIVSTIHAGLILSAQTEGVAIDICVSDPPTEFVAAHLIAFALVIIQLIIALSGIRDRRVEEKSKRSLVWLTLITAISYFFGEAYTRIAAVSAYSYARASECGPACLAGIESELYVLGGIFSLTTCICVGFILLVWALRKPEAKDRMIGPEHISGQLQSCLIYAPIGNRRAGAVGLIVVPQTAKENRHQ